MATAAPVVAEAMRDVGAVALCWVEAVTEFLLVPLRSSMPSTEQRLCVQPALSCCWSPSQLRVLGWVLTSQGRVISTGENGRGHGNSQADCQVPKWRGMDWFCYLKKCLGFYYFELSFKIDEMLKQKSLLEQLEWNFLLHFSSSFHPNQSPLVIQGTAASVASLSLPGSCRGLGAICYASTAAQRMPVTVLSFSSELRKEEVGGPGEGWGWRMGRKGSKVQTLAQGLSGRW